jgi:hypothetical protein
MLDSVWAMTLNFHLLIQSLDMRAQELPAKFFIAELNGKKLKRRG